MLDFAEVRQFLFVFRDFTYTLSEHTGYTLPIALNAVKPPKKVKMRKLVLGIFAVVCVQFAFVIYTALQSPLDLAVGPIFSDMIADRTATDLDETPAAPVVDESENEGSGSEPSKKLESRQPSHPERAEAPERDQRSTDRTSPVEARPIRSDEGFETLRTAAPNDFETVVISYDRSPEISECDKIRYDAPQPKKRSYIAKAAPVVKKPWEWIKAVGSKLN